MALSFQSQFWRKLMPVLEIHVPCPSEYERAVLCHCWFELCAIVISKEVSWKDLLRKVVTSSEMRLKDLLRATMVSSEMRLKDLSHCRRSAQVVRVDFASTATNRRLPLRIDWIQAGQATILNSVRGHSTFNPQRQYFCTILFRKLLVVFRNY